ncbi:Hypothetical protein NocV09_00302970 [Nannochloropsis oceanica]
MQPQALSRILHLAPLLLALIPTSTASDVLFEATNFATPPSNEPHFAGATALVPHPSKLYQFLDKMYPFLAPLPPDRGKGGSKWPRCAWQVATEPSASSFGLLDLNAFYHTLVIWDFHDSDVYRIKGRFPAARYFSIQSYEFSNGKAIASMLDRDIRPATGKNPYNDLSASPAHRGTFDIYLTAHGNQGLPNELQVKRPGNHLEEKEPVTIIYRMYDADVYAARGDEGAWTPKQQFWGFTDPAVVEHRTHDGRWTEVPACTDFGSALFQATFTDLYPVLKHFPATAASCPMAQLSDDVFPSMILFGAGLEQGYAASITSYTNYDTRYLYWCAQEAKMGPNMVIRMQGKLPRVPQGLYSGERLPRVAQSELYDARYISISTIDMLFPSPTYQEVEDHDIERFYSEVPGWAEHDRTYSIIFSIDQKVALACNLYDADTQLFLAWDDAYDYGLGPTRMPSIVYRELLPTPAAGGRSLKDVDKACHAVEKTACGDGSFIRGVMGDIYPRIDVFECDPTTGIATLLA